MRIPPYLGEKYLNIGVPSSTVHGSRLKTMKMECF